MNLTLDVAITPMYHEYLPGIKEESDKTRRGISLANLRLHYTNCY